jgi:hypothetical protein
MFYVIFITYQTALVTVHVPVYAEKIIADGGRIECRNKCMLLHSYDIS